MSNDSVRNGVAGTNLPVGSTKEAEELQARMPKKQINQEKQTTFQGAGTCYFNLKEGSPKIEVQFKKGNGHRYHTSDKLMIEALKKKGFKIITEAQLREEAARRLKEGRSEKATNATMQDYVDLKIEELKAELDGSDNSELLSKIEGMENAFVELKKIMASNKENINKRVDRLKSKVEGAK